jgi:hypothetical protein
MAIDRDKDSERLANIELVLKKLCVTADRLNALATLAQARAKRRIAETKDITDRQSRRGPALTYAASASHRTKPATQDGRGRASRGGRARTNTKHVTKPKS